TRSYCHLDGKIYVIGGFSEGIITASTQVYDIASNQWELVANMNQNRGAGTAHAVDNKIYVISGHGFGGTYPDSVNVEEYDPGTDSWTLKKNIPKLFWAHSSCLYNDSIYVFGGNNNIDGSLSSVFVYDPQTDTWESLPDMNHAIWGPACCVFNDKIYVFGGLGNGDSLINEVEVYDPATGTWEEEKRNNMPEATLSSWITLYEGKINLFGGLDEEMEYFNFVYQYDPTTDIFIRMQDLPFKCGGGLQVNNYVYFLDGTSGSIYDPNNEIWRFNLDSLKEYTGGETSIKQPFQDANNNFVLHQNYPNPFSGSTHISYELTAPGKVQLEIFSILGEKIITLVNESQNPGSYEITWNAKDVKQGIYFIKLNSGDLVETRKVVVY
ncbi:MAG: T9SS type A sorting domain-containing protein, partial [Bacteroidales bacterium]